MLTYIFALQLEQYDIEANDASSYKRHMQYFPNTCSCKDYSVATIEVVELIPSSTIAILAPPSHPEREARNRYSEIEL